MADLRVEQAAGGVVWRAGKQGIEVLIVHRAAYRDWTLPKGKLDAGESLVECARREVIEETGVRPVIGRYLGTITYYKRNGRPENGGKYRRVEGEAKNGYSNGEIRRKEVHYWAMRAEGAARTACDEVDGVRWVSEEDLAGHLTYETEQGLVTDMRNGWRSPADRILLIRHAKAGSRSEWEGDDSKRPLSERGRRQAEAVVGRLEGFPIDSILTSRAARCRKTVAPLAEARRLVPEISEDLWEEAGPGRIEALIGELSGGARLLCSHRPNVTAALRTLLGGAAGPRLEKGSTWVFDFDRGKLAAANYLAAP